METRASACPLDCPDLCSLEVTVEQGRVVSVEGGRKTPITNGFICGKVRKIADHLYGPDRVLTPLLRVGAKGQDRWRAIEWDDALALIAERLGEIRARAGGEAILPYTYGGSNGWLSDGGLAERFFRRLGASRLARTFCAAATGAAVRGLYGKSPGVALEDYVHAKLIVLWGVNPSATSIHLVPIIDEARKRGAKLVVVDPRRTPLAKRADLHLAVRPGTDLPVALAVAHALFSRGLADRAFLSAHCDGVEELARRAAEWPLARAAEEAGLSPVDLERFVALYAESSPAVIRVGWGLERNRNGGSAAAAVLALPAIAGKFGVRGGGYTMSNGDARWGLDPEAAVAEPEQATRVINMSQIASALATATPRIEALFVYNCNPAATAPDQAALLRELAREDLFVVVHEQVMTDTAQLADLVLPATAFLEHREVRRGYGAMRLYDSPAVATAPGQARSNHQLFGALLDRMGLTRPGEATTEDELVAAIFASAPHGAALRAQIEREGVAVPPVGTAPLLFIDLLPATANQRVQLVPPALDAEAGGLYRYKPDPTASDARFPLALISPALATQITSTFGQLRQRPAEVDISPQDAAARRIDNGARVRLWNNHGEVVCLARIDADVRPGVLVLAKGLWRKHTANGFTSNALIPEGLADLGGQAAYNDARVEIAPL